MASILSSLGLGIGGALAIWGLYRALRITWPDQYMSLNDTFALRVTQTWWRLTLYRFVPVFFAAIAIGTTTDRLHGIAALAIWTASVLHVLTSNFTSLLEGFGALKKRGDFVVNYGSAHLAAIGVVLVATVLGQFLQPSLSVLVPEPSVLLENLWIAVFIAIAGGIVVGVVGERPKDARFFGSDYLVWRAIRDVRIDLMDAAFKASVDTQGDPILLRSIIFTEALQRPRWVRSLERAKGLIFKKGTYGVAQASADAPISDVESINRAARCLSGLWGIENLAGFWVPNEDLMWRAAARHNEDFAFIDGVKKIYFAIQAQSYRVPQFPASAPVYLVETRRYSHEAGLRMISSVNLLSISYKEPGGQVATQFKLRPEGAATWALEFRIPMGTRFVDFHYRTDDGACTFTHEINASEQPSTPG